MDYKRYLNILDNLGVSDALKQGLKARAEILWHRQPPDLERIALYWHQAVLGQERIIVFGAGTFAEKLLAMLDQSGPTKQVFAFVDSDVEKRDFTNFPRPVYHVDRLIDLKFEALIVMHPFAEDKMVRAALSVGCAPEKVVRVFSSSEYRGWEQTQLKNRMAIGLKQYQSSQTNHNGKL